MREKGLSQAELARRIGVSQPAIFALIHKNKTGSKSLHRIALELETTPAFLNGETDVRDPEFPGEPTISADERATIELLRSMNQRDRAAVMRIVRSLALPRQGRVESEYEASIPALQSPNLEC